MGSANRTAEEKMALSRKYQNLTGRPRERVVGDGPSREFLPPFQELVELPPDLQRELLSYLETHIQENHLAQPSQYKISQACPLRFAIPEGFQHLLLTYTKQNSNPLAEINYSDWTLEAKKLNFYSWMKDHFPSAFRVRLAVLPPGAEFGWHIDTNTSVACRCSIPLNETQAQFEIKTRGEIVHQIPHQPRQVYFTNTGWPHRVYNPSPIPRINLVFGVLFRDLSKWIDVSSGSLYGKR